MTDDEFAACAQSLIVREKAEIARDIFRFKLTRPDDGELAAFLAGAHIEMRAPNGARKKYSLCNDPDAREHYEIAIKREVAGAGGSMSMIDALQVGDTLAVAPPRNDFPLAANVQNFLFIAGGIGITPILSMMRHLKTSAAGRFKLIYLTRAPDMTAFAEELRQPQFSGQVSLHHDGGDPDKAFDLWPVLEKPMARHLYCCGPRPLMEAVRDMSGHWSSAAVHFEDFGATGAHKPQDKPFHVTLARSAKTCAVPANVSILDVLRAEGVAVSSSCESGSCGSCRTRLVSGDVEHRDLVLSQREHATDIMICVSRARSGDLVIDL